MGSVQCFMRLYQIIRNFTACDLAIPLEVIRPGQFELKKTRLVHLPDLFEGGVEKGQCNLVYVERLWMIGLMMVMLISYSRVMSVVLVLGELVLFKGKGMEFSDKKYFLLFEESEIPSG